MNTVGTAVLEYVDTQSGCQTAAMCSCVYIHAKSEIRSKYLLSANSERGRRLPFQMFAHVIIVRFGRH